MGESVVGSLFGDQDCFGCGPAHAAGFRMRFHEDGEDVVTRVVPGEGHQGAPSIMHGGLIFTIAFSSFLMTTPARHTHRVQRTQ